ncbi:flagellar filament capping protein FliD [Kiloniella sp.]|uniref:flagellar filament capping protein FliD n=1 Tax=Kiloniella sp. TaxID=1938587 RepID=UPI003B02BE07
MLPADDLEVKITENDAEIAAYQEMQNLLSAITDSLYPMTNPTGLLGDEENVFYQKEAYLSSSDVSSPTSLLGVSVDSTAPEGVYELEVQQLATTHKVASAEQSDADVALGLSGIFELSSASGTSTQITVTSDMTLSDLTDAINDVSETSGVSATLLQVSEGSYQLVLTGEDTNQALSMSSVSGDDIQVSLGVQDGSGAYLQELQAAQSAILLYDGLTITRDDNSIDNLIDGVTIDLYGAEPGSTVSLEIGSDLASVKDQIIAFVDAYNAYREFAITQQETTTAGGASDEAVLFSDSLLRNTNMALFDGLNSTLDNSDLVDSLDDIGITFNEDNTLALDETVLDEALLDNVDAVQSLFEFGMTSSSEKLLLLDSEPEHGGLSFNLEVTTDGTSGGITGVTVDGASDLFTYDGSRLLGVEGTIYEGLSLAYSGSDASATIAVSFEQGIADTLYKDISSYDEVLTTTIEGISDENEDYEAEITDIEQRAADYEENLIDQYAVMEAQIAASNATLAQIKAVLGVSDD